MAAPDPVLPVADRCLVMGIVNVTEDSFSDGGRWNDPAVAVALARRLMADGADLIDVGGESTRPGAVRVSADEELGRVVPVVRELAAGGSQSASTPCARRWRRPPSRPGR